MSERHPEGQIVVEQRGSVLLMGVDRVEKRNGFTPRMFRELDRKGVYQMLSNSDPKNTDPGDDFFETAYAKYGGTFWRVPASRAINSNAKGRGRINEIVITNYEP